MASNKKAQQRKDFKEKRAAEPKPVLEKDSNSIEIQGRVTVVLPGGQFRVKLENGIEILAHVSGKMRVNKISIFLGDTVRVELSPYDLTRGIINYRVDNRTLNLNNNTNK